MIEQWKFVYGMKGIACENIGFQMNAQIRYA